MERDECIKHLEELLTQIKQLNNATTELEEEKKRFKKLQTKPLSAVENFDKLKKEEYIRLNVGVEPVKPKGVIKLAVPIYISKKKEYKKQYAEYMIQYKEAEEKYYLRYKDTRETLESEEKAERNLAIKSSEEAVLKVKESYENALKVLSENNIVGEKFKDSNIIKILIEYFQDKRADSIKEAINLYYEEEHRKRLEEYAKEQVRMTTEAAEQARLAAECASEAADSASEAADSAAEAINLAEEAYEIASEVYDKEFFDYGEELGED